MAHKTDFGKARAKRKEEKEKEAARKAMFRRKETYWKPKVGESRFRLLPPWTDEGPNANQFWREVYMHFGVTCYDAPDLDNAFSASCPKETPGAAVTLGLDPDSKIGCPICEAVTKLRQSSDPADVEMAKQSRAKTRIHSNVIDLEDPTWTQEAITALKANGAPEEHLPKLGDPKIQVYTYGVTVMNMILDFFQDGVDLTDLTKGRDLILTKEGSGIQTKYRLRPDMDPSKAPINDKQLAAHIEDLDTLNPFFNGEQMDAMLAGANIKEVFALAAKEETEELAEGESEEPAAELEAHEEPEEPAEEPEASAEPEEAAAEHWDGKDTPPVDEDGDVDYDKLTDEQIEDPANEQYDGVHISCYGVARKLDVKDKDCVDDCGLFDRCKARNEQLDAAEAAKKKKGVGKKKKGAGKKKAGKGNGATEKKDAAETAPATGGTEDDLEAEMKAALGK